MLNNLIAAKADHQKFEKKLKLEQFQEAGYVEIVEKVSMRNVAENIFNPFYMGFLHLSFIRRAAKIEVL